MAENFSNFSFVENLQKSQEKGPSPANINSMSRNRRIKFGSRYERWPLGSLIVWVLFNKDFKDYLGRIKRLGPPTIGFGKFARSYHGIPRYIIFEFRYRLYHLVN